MPKACTGRARQRSTTMPTSAIATPATGVLVRNSSGNGRCIAAITHGAASMHVASANTVTPTATPSLGRASAATASKSANAAKSGNR